MEMLENSLQRHVCYALVFVTAYTKFCFDVCVNMGAFTYVHSAYTFIVEV